MKKVTSQKLWHWKRNETQPTNTQQEGSQKNKDPEITLFVPSHLLSVTPIDIQKVKRDDLMWSCGPVWERPKRANKKVVA